MSECLAFSYHGLPCQLEQGHGGDHLRGRRSWPISDCCGVRYEHNGATVTCTCTRLHTLDHCGHFDGQFRIMWPRDWKNAAEPKRCESVRDGDSLRCDDPDGHEWPHVGYREGDGYIEWPNVATRKSAV